MSDLSKDSSELLKYKELDRKIKIGQAKKEVKLKIEKFESELKVIEDNQRLHKAAIENEKALVQITQEVIDLKKALELSEADKNMHAENITYKTKEFDDKLKNLENYTLEDLNRFHNEYQKYRNSNIIENEFKTFCMISKQHSILNEDQAKPSNALLRLELLKEFKIAEKTHYKLTKKGEYFWYQFSEEFKKSPATKTIKQR